jgi:hypothetical protein
MNPGMGLICLLYTNDSQCFKLNDSDYMNAMSSVEAENKNYTVNQLSALAKTNYYQWIIWIKNTNRQ